MGCGIYTSDDWKYIISGLESKLSININASIDYTGDASLGGNWILEEGNVNLIGTYFSDNIKGYKYILGSVGSSTYVIAKVATDSDGKNLDFTNSLLYGVGSNTKSDLVYYGDVNTEFIQIKHDADSVRLFTVRGMCSFSIDSLGKLWVTGQNSYGNLGTGDKFTRSIWTKLPNNYLDLDTDSLSVIDIFAVAQFTMILLSNGQVWICGIYNDSYNNSGKININTSKFIRFYNPSENNGKKVKKIGQGSDENRLGLIFQDGTISGAIERGSINSSVSLPSPVKDILIIYAYPTIFLLDNGTIMFKGQVVVFPSGLTNVVSIFEFCIIDIDGNVWVHYLDYSSVFSLKKIYDAVANNNDKAVNIPTADRSPIDITTYLFINSHGEFGMGAFQILTESGSLYAAGRNSNGMMGNSSIQVNTYYPTLQLTYTPRTENEKIKFISSKKNMSLIVKQNGSIWGAGSNGIAAYAIGPFLGAYNTNSSRFIIDLGVKAKHITTNGSSTAVVTADNKLFTKGENRYGQLGLGYASNVIVNEFTLAYTPIEDITIEYVSMGGQYGDGTLMMCLSDGRVMSCGRNYPGRAGYIQNIHSNVNQNNTFVTIYTPDPNDEGTKAIKCSSDLYSSLFILNSGTVYICDSTNFTIGPTIVYQPDPIFEKPGDKYPATFATAGQETIAIVTSDGSVWMKGFNYAGLNGSAFGLGSKSEDVFNLSFPQASIGDFNGSATQTYDVVGFGIRTKVNSITRLYNLYRVYRPEDPTNQGLGAVLVACGPSFTAILTSSGCVKVTGNNNAGQLGLGDYNSRSSWTESYCPTPENNIPVRSIKCGESSVSIILGNGSVMSVGKNSAGMFGTGGDGDIILNWIHGVMQNVTTLGPLTNAYSLNDSEGTLITSPTLGPFFIPSKSYDYTDPVTGEKTFAVTPPTSTSQGAYSYESSDSTIASFDSVTGVITINSDNKLGTTIIRVTQSPFGTYTDTTFKQTSFTVLGIDPELGNFEPIEKWFNSRTLGASPFRITQPTTLSAGLFTYISSNTSVATVSGNDIIIIGVGTSTIRATQEANGIYNSGSITTTLIVNALVNPTLSSFTIDDVLYGSESFTFSRPTYLSGGPLTYSVSSTDKASIDSVTGVITLNAIGELGRVTVTASLEDNGIYAAATTSTTFNITPLNPELENFSVPNKTYGDANFLIVEPNSLSDGTFTYTFLNVYNNDVNSSVLSITGTLLTIIGAGTVRVVATQAAYGIYTSSSIETTMTVAKASVNYVTPWNIPRRPLNYFEKTGLLLYVNDPTQVPYSNAISGTTSAGAITYSSSDSSIASVNATTGELTLYNIGETTITVTQSETENFLQGTISTSFRVTNPVSIFGLFVIGVKRIGDDPFTVTAPTSTNPSRVFTFTSSDTSKATITRIDDENATVTIISTGHVDIICTQLETEDYSEASITFDLNILKIVTTLGELSVPSSINYLSPPFTISEPTSSRLGPFTFASSDTEVATIDLVTGLVTIHQAGTTNISCTQVETTYYYSEIVTTKLIVAKVQSQITSNFSNLSVNYGSDSVTLEDPTTTSTDTNVFSYLSSNIYVASMLGNVLTFVNAGTATITCTLLESTNYLSSSTTFTVTVSPISTTYPNGWSIETITYAPGLVITLPEPVSVNLGSFTYTSSNTEIASVSGNELYILRAGIVTITATESATNNYNTGSISTVLTILRATPSVGPFSVQPATFGDAPLQLTLPTTNSDGTWRFASSDETVATINGAIITILTAGTIIITGVLVRTLKYATATTTTSFVINKKIPIISGFPDITKTYLDESFTLTNPTSDSNGLFIYSSSDTAVATVDSETGLVIINGAGSTTIIANQQETINFTSVSISAVLTVSKATPIYEQYIISDQQVNYYDPPFNGPAVQTTSNAPVSFSSSNTNVATIDNTRLVDPIHTGTTTITISQPENENFLAGQITVLLTIGICFPAGTPVKTDQGIIAIEKINSKINTIRGNKIVAITKTITPQKHIVTIEKDSLDMNMPSRNTFISMNHCVLYKGKMERARDLVGKVDGVYLKKYNGEILYNVLLDKHSKMIVNNMIVETLDPTNIVAKLYNGNYTPEEFNKISVDISAAVAKDDKKQYEKIYKSLK